MARPDILDNSSLPVSPLIQLLTIKRLLSSSSTEEGDNGSDFRAGILRTSSDRRGRDELNRRRAREKARDSSGVANGDPSLPPPQQQQQRLKDAAAESCCRIVRIDTLCRLIGKVGA